MPPVNMKPSLQRGPAMTAEDFAKALGGRKVGGGWMARCPAHHDREPSLSIREADDGKILVHCHAGCDQARVISILRSRGLWAENGAHLPKHSEPPAAAMRQPARDDTKRTKSRSPSGRLRSQPMVRWWRLISPRADLISFRHLRSASMLG